MNRQSPVAEQNAQAVIDYLTAEQAKDMKGRSRMEIEIAIGLLHNQWDKTMEKMVGMLKPADPNAAKKNYKYILVTA